MRYEDASSSFTAAEGTTDARNDEDALAAGSRGPASGNTITGAGTITGVAGADIVANGPGQIVALEGANGSDTADGGSLSVSGRYGDLTMDSRGGYRYEKNDETPDGARDVFRYTLADAAGARDTATLTINIGREPLKVDANAQQIIPGPDGVVTLPPGVQLSDVHVVGRNLVIDMPDGSQMVIIDGAVFVPQLVLGGVEVPASNLAALLIDAEPQPAAGTPLSSGGNFAVDVPPLDPGVPLGDLIPPTELDYEPPIFEDVGQFEDEEPEITIQPDGQPASVAAVDSVDEAGLPARNGNLPNEPAGSDSAANSETTTGTILINSPDDPSVVTINGTAVTSIGQVFVGTYGTLTITSISDSAIGYSYTLTDNNLLGNATHDDFSVSVTDNDGDVATATLTINIVDDVPTARNDTDASVNGVATGNVMTDAAPGDAGDSDTNAADTVGADNATLTAVSGSGGSDSTFSEGLLAVNGTYGSLTIDAAGNYTYTVNPNAGGGGVDVFTYTLTDGDGDTTTATLTITNPNLVPNLANPDAVLLDDDALTDGNAGGTDDDPDSAGLPGQLEGTGGDGDLDYNFTGVNTLPAGFTANPVSASVVQILQGGTVVLTITLDTETGAFNVVQNNPIDHPVAGESEDNLVFSIGVEVEDVDGDVEPASITINVDDDTPEIVREDVSVPTLNVDETDLATDDTGDFSTLFSVDYGADGAGTTSYAVSVVDGTDSGLVDVATGDSIFLFNDGGVIEGRVGGVGGATAFTVSVDSASGVVTLDQVRALDHPNAADHDDPVSPNADSIQFTVSAVDGDGDPVSQTINIGDKIVFEDDGPTAVDDTDSVVEGDSVSGNVLTGLGEDGNPAGADASGSDGFPAGTVVGVVAGGNDAVDTTNANVGVSIPGSWGTLVLNADGTYTYTATPGLNPPPGTTDVFTYTIVDNDGDRDSATLTISVIDDLTPTVTVPTTGAGTAVSEVGLPIRGSEPAGTGEIADGNGTDDDDHSEFTSGTINFTPGDAPATVTIDGAGLGGPVVITGPGQTIVGEYGTMTINSYNAGTGVITYTYQLTDNVDHDSDTGTDTFVVTVTDVDLDVATANLVINIANDAPIARDDTDSVVEGASTDGNVITGANTTSGTAGADIPGADGLPAGAVVGVVAGDTETNVINGTGVGASVIGTYGTLVLGANGTYTYTANAGTNPPPGATDVFTYTIIDNDGNASNAELIISVIDDLTPVAGSTAATVDDEGLANGILGGTGDLDANLAESDGIENPSEAVFNGVLQGTDGDGTTTFLFTESLESTHPTVGTERIDYVVSADGLTLTATVAALDGGGQPQARAGQPLFTVVITNADTGAYTLTLQNNILHDPVANGGDDTENDATLVIPYQMRDADGDLSVSPGSLTVTFDDDTPRAIQPEAITSGLNNEIGASETADLDDDVVSEVITDFGADGPGLVTFANIVNGVDSGLDSGGDNITYWLSNNGQTLQGRTNSTNGTDGELIFTVAINQAAGTYSVTMAGTIDNGSGVEFADLSGGDAGNPAFKLIESSTADALELLVTPIGNTTVNSDEDDIATGSQFIEFDDGIRFDFGQFTFHPNGGGGADDRFTIDGHADNTNGFRFSIDQISNGTVVDIRVTAIDADEDGGAQQLNIAPDVDDVIDDITLIKVFDDNNVLVGEFSATDTTTHSFDVIFNADGSVSFENLPSDYSIQTYTVDGYNRIEVLNEGTASPDGKFSLSNLAIESVDSGDPIQLTYDLQITDADGDTVPLPGALDITIDPAGTPAPLALSAASFNQESGEDNSSLSLMIEDSPEQQRTMSAANNNSVLLGAIAAAGLGSGSLAAARDFGSGGDQDFGAIAASAGGLRGQGSRVDNGDSARNALDGETQVPVADQSSGESSSKSSADRADNSLTDADSAEADSPAALDKGTEAEQSAAAESSLTSASVGMPSAEMLAAANGNGQAALEGQAKTNGEVGRVLADALAGGTQGPNIDAVIDAVANHGGAGRGANAALEAIASHGGAAVPAWHTADMAGFLGGHSMPTMETMVIHPDAAPQAA